MAKCIGICLLLFCSVTLGYTNITPADLHQRLINLDTLIILDVREWSEYSANHIAEPAGQLPFTPACMPWNSSILQANYGRLPANIDIVVHCQSGGRSASASTFLEQNGFNRVFNMTGGFNAWNAALYEKRTGRFGDHTGAWINTAFTAPVAIAHDSGSLLLYPAAVSGLDSVYCEVHFAYGRQPAPQDAPVSDVAGLFRLTALDRFGLSLFAGDSLVLHDTAGVNLVPHPKSGPALPPSLTQTNITALAGPGKWQTLTSDYQASTYTFHRSEPVLRRWYNAAGSAGNGISFRQGSSPRPIGSSDLPALHCYDLRGRLLTRHGVPSPHRSSQYLFACGYYIIDTPRERLSGITLDRSPCVIPSHR